MMDRNYHREYSRNYYHKRMTEIKNRLGGKCVLCDSTENLEIHHLDPLTKKYNISKKVLSIKYDDLDDELNKCVLLCHKCHIKESKKQTLERLSTKKLITVRPVICIEDNLKFSSISECASYYNTYISIIQRVCSGKRKTWNKKHFIYDGNKITKYVNK